MNALDHGVMGQDQRFPADVQHRTVIGQPARGGMLRDGAQGGDEIDFLANISRLTISKVQSPSLKIRIGVHWKVHQLRLWRT